MLYSQPLDQQLLEECLFEQSVLTQLCFTDLDNLVIYPRVQGFQMFFNESGKPWSLVSNEFIPFNICSAV